MALAPARDNLTTFANSIVHIIITVTTYTWGRATRLPRDPLVHLLPHRLPFLLFPFFH